jgi:hypothetical protein
MFTLAIKLLYYESLRFLRRLKTGWVLLLLSLFPAVVQNRCARRMESLAGRLRRMQAKIARFEEYIRSGGFDELIDADSSIRAMLAGLKEDIRAIRCELSGMEELGRDGFGAVRLNHALEGLHRVAEDTYRAADRLQWEIDEHDLAFREAVT